MSQTDDRKKEEDYIVVETYSEELSALTNSPSMVLVHKFGKRQNKYNRDMTTRMQVVQTVCRRFQREITELQEENARLQSALDLEKNRNRTLFDRMARDMKAMQAEINRLRLSTQLNNNAIERLVREAEAEKENPTEE